MEIAMGNSAQEDVSEWLMRCGVCKWGGRFFKCGVLVCVICMLLLLRAGILSVGLVYLCTWDKDNDVS